eukprot:9174799-Pyramimonas_sp.AAC.1
MPLTALDQSDWIAAAGGLAFVSEAPTCRQVSPGTHIDYFICSSWLAPKLDPCTCVLEAATTYPHLPVQLTLRARETPVWARVAK